MLTKRSRHGFNLIQPPTSRLHYLSESDCLIPRRYIISILLTGELESLDELSLTLFSRREGDKTNIFNSKHGSLIVIVPFRVDKYVDK